MRLCFPNPAHYLQVMHRGETSPHAPRSAGPLAHRSPASLRLRFYSDSSVSPAKDGGQGSHGAQTFKPSQAPNQDGKKEAADPGATACR